jgi:hypothetical protein
MPTESTNYKLTQPSMGDDVKETIDALSSTIAALDTIIKTLNDKINGSQLEYNNSGTTGSTEFYPPMTVVGDRCKVKVTVPQPLSIICREPKELLPGSVRSHVVGSYAIIEKINDTAYAFVELVGAWERPM